MKVIGPDATVAFQGGFDNTFEYVDFKPAQTGTYRIQFVKWRCDGTFNNNRLAMALHQAP